MQIREIEVLSESTWDAFLDQNPLSVIHLDADWDENGKRVKEKMETLIASYPDVAFGYVDVDRCPDHVAALGLLNVPSCAYYQGRSLIALVIGSQQDIAAHVERARRGPERTEPVMILIEPSQVHGTQDQGDQANRFCPGVGIKSSQREAGN